MGMQSAVASYQLTSSRRKIEMAPSRIFLVMLVVACLAAAVLSFPADGPVGPKRIHKGVAPPPGKDLEGSESYGFGYYGYPGFGYGYGYGYPGFGYGYGSGYPGFGYGYGGYYGYYPFYGGYFW